MTPLARLFRDALERLLARYYEGPDPPARLRAMAEDFAGRHPRATRRDWLDFAAAHAEECYRSGWARGHEYVERYERPYYRPESPEALADLEEHGWEWSAPVRLDEGNLAEVVPDALAGEDDEVRRIAVELGLRPPGEG